MERVARESVEMIEITLLELDTKIVGVRSCGHANFDQPGRDIVCAGISALTWTAYIGLEQYLRRNLSAGAAHGMHNFMLRGKPDEGTEIVFRVLQLGLEAMEKNYPQNVKLTVVQVGGEYVSKTRQGNCFG